MWWSLRKDNSFFNVLPSERDANMGAEGCSASANYVHLTPLGFMIWGFGDLGFKGFRVCFLQIVQGLGFQCGKDLGFLGPSPYGFQLFSTCLTFRNDEVPSIIAIKFCIGVYG